jgi:hypothetical protein
VNNANRINHNVFDKFFTSSGGEELHDLDYEIHDEDPNHHLVAFNEEGSNGNKFCDIDLKEFELVM